MGSRQTLYEVLQIAPGAGKAEIQSAYRHQANALEEKRGSMNSDEFTNCMQMLRLALSTLTDPVSRLGYDAKLTANSAPYKSSGDLLTLVPLEKAAVEAANETRADALSMRADALSLRADALLLRGTHDAAPTRSDRLLKTAAKGTLNGLEYFIRVIVFLVLMGITVFLLGKCTTGGSSASRAKEITSAQEKTVLQEYFQTYGVRPANMAELELLEAERRRSENGARSKVQDIDKAEREAQRFEQESRKRADEVSRALHRAEEKAEFDQRRDAQELQAKEDRERNRAERERNAEANRIERERQGWRDIMRR